MSSVTVNVSMIVDPCGRVLVHEIERPAPGESFDIGASRPPDCWYHAPQCARYRIQVTVPLPMQTTPTSTIDRIEDTP